MKIYANYIFFLAVAAIFTSRAKADDAYSIYANIVIPQTSALAKKFAGRPYCNVYDVESEHTENGKREYVKGTFVDKQSGRFILASSIKSLPPAPPEKQMHGVNGRYFFKLVRNRKDTDWLLRGIESLTSPTIDKNIDAQNIIKRAAAGGFLNGADSLLLHDGYVTIKALSQMRGYKLDEINTVENGKYLSLAFSYDVTVGVGQTVRSTCEMQFDLSMNSALTKLNEKFTTTSGVITKSYMAKYTVIGENLVVRETIRSLDLVVKGVVRVHDRDTVADHVRFENIGDSDFTLSAFGLPEPPGYEAPRTPLYVWLIAVAAVCFVLTVGFRLLARRRRANV